MHAEPSLEDLPVPYESLIELGLSHEDVVEAARRRPRDIAFQADQLPGAYFSVTHVRQKLKALGGFHHTTGRWFGVPLKLGRGLDSWQVVWIIAPVFGWVVDREDIGRTVRVIRHAWFEIPRKNGKSTISSAISGLLLLADKEMGGEVYNAATSRTQASRVFDAAKQMLLSSPAARAKIEPLNTVVRVPHTASILRVLSRVADAAHGLNVSGAVIDEIHVMRLQRRLIEAIETGVGARDQPLIVYITTSDEAEEGTPYDERHTITVNMAEGHLHRPSHYGIIWGASDDDDLFSDETLAQANPGAGKSPTWEYLHEQRDRALSTPSYLATYKQLVLNIRSRNASRWVDLNKWDALPHGYQLPLRGRRAWGGLDLSAVNDFTAWAVWVESMDPDRMLDLFVRYWIPENRVPELTKQLQVPLQDWIDQGWVTPTEGDVIDYGAVQKAVLADAEFFDMQRIGYDRMFAGQLVQEVEQEIPGIDVVGVGQGYLGLSAAAKAFERLWLDKAMAWDANPVTRWMAAKVEIKKDDLENIRPIKPDRAKSSSRIDGFQAAATGLDGWVRSPVNETPDVVHTGTSTARRR